MADMNLVIIIPEDYIPKHQNIIDLRLYFRNGHIIKAGEYDFYELSSDMCTQRCCLKNHNIGIIKCDEDCFNRTKF